jgi:hypothetical protein
MRTGKVILSVVCLGAISGTPGCGQREPQRTPESRADAKVQAIKRLAEAMAQDPDGLKVREALEDFRTNRLDPRKNPTQADAIVDVYRQQIQGKYKGLVALEIEAEMQPLLTRPR